MDKKTKAKDDSQLLRVPKAKTNRFGLKVPAIRMPHEDLIKPECPKIEAVEENSASLPSQTIQSDVAPIKNFQKIPNSITRSAIPEGLFKQGKSKHLYDILYSLTRGAIEPKRSVRLSKTKLRKLAGIGSRVTFDSCILHLQNVGLLKLTVYIGEHTGNEFEVFVPEEITLTSHTRLTSQSSVTRHAQKLVRLVSLETSQTSQSLNLIDTSTSDISNTSLKTYKNDDEETFAEFIKIFNNAAQELTGKKLNQTDAPKLRNLAELLVLELRAAARRTETVTNVAAFLTEVLRRKLLNQPTPKISKTKIDAVGKSADTDLETREYEIKDLDEQGREAALAELREFAGEKFLDDFKKWYTSKDWNWITENLPKV